MEMRQGRNASLKDRTIRHYHSVIKRMEKLISISTDILEREKLYPMHFNGASWNDYYIALPF